MNTVCFSIPASPTEGFFGQIVLFSKAVSRQRWERWTPRVRAIFGEKPDPDILAKWLPNLHDVDLLFLDPKYQAEEGYFAQGDERFFSVPPNTDVLVLADADTLLLGSIEDMLDEVLEMRGVAGVVAHWSYPTNGRHALQDDWQALANEFTGHQLAFQYRYTMAGEALEDRAPFYVNFGFVSIATSVLPELRDYYLPLRRALMESLDNNYFSAQVGFALTVDALKIPHKTLPFRYNYPNDPAVDALHQEELREVRVMHYLRTSHFDRNEIASDKAKYMSFLNADLKGSNALFRDRVSDILGPDGP